MQNCYITNKITFKCIPTGPFHGISDNASALDAASNISELLKSLSAKMGEETGKKS